MKRDADGFLPLNPASLHILLVLAGGERHGYGIMREVARQSGGRYRLGPGTLYDGLQRLADRGLVESAGSRAASGEESRRRPAIYYRLTALGRRVLSAEIARLETVIREARLRLPASQPGRA